MFGRQSQREQPTANGVAEGLTKLDLVRGCVAVLLRGVGLGSKWPCYTVRVCARVRLALCARACSSQHARTQQVPCLLLWL